MANLFSVYDILDNMENSFLLPSDSSKPTHVKWGMFQYAAIRDMTLTELLQPDM